MPLAEEVETFRAVRFWPRAYASRPARARLGVLLEDVRPARQPGLQLRVEVEDEREGGGRDDDAEGDAEALDAGADAARDALPAERDREQDDARAERVRDGDGDRLEAEVERRGRGGDERDRRPAARHEDESERAAEQEPAAEVARRAARQPRQRPLDPARRPAGRSASPRSGRAARSRCSAAGRRGSPSWSRIQVANRIETRKVTASPAMIAYGRRRLPLAPPASTIGSTGRTHGEIAVISPATKANPIATPI